MSFIYSNYIFFAVIFIITFSIYQIRIQGKFFRWVEDHWFLNKSSRASISNFFYLLAIGLFVLALLDLRGKEVNIKSHTSEERTIILIDTSASMLVEDVRPNRFEKSLLLVKHYLKQATGQKVAVMVFSDGQKTIVPFTDDYNLLNARIETLKNLNLSRGGTGLSLAVQESIQYFKDTAEDPKGNILIFTDAEENDGGIQMDVPSNISVAVVGIGTARGGPIPLRDRNGVFRGNKKFKGKEVVSKLDEAFLKKMSDKIKNYNYWIAGSYSLPTREILSFFSKAADLRDSENQFRIRPVLVEYLLIPGFFLLIVSYLLKFRGVFKVLGIILVLNLGNGKTFAQNPEVDEPVKSPETLAMEEAFIEGTLSDDEKQALASSLLKDNFPEQAEQLYNEVLPEKLTEENLYHHFNNGTANLKTKKIGKAIERYKRILDFIEKNPDTKFKDIEKITKENLLKALMSQQGQGSGKGKESDEKSDKQKNQKSESSEKGNEKKDEDNKGDDQKDQKEKKDQDQSGKDKEKEKENESEQEKKERKKKLPALLKQLLNDDNKLQKKMIDAETTERKKRDKKDW